jgi:hypothetical protein
MFTVFGRQPQCLLKGSCRPASESLHIKVSPSGIGAGYAARRRIGIIHSRSTRTGMMGVTTNERRLQQIADAFDERPIG